MSLVGNPAREGSGSKSQGGEWSFRKMRHVRRWVDREDDQAGADRQTESLAGLAFALVLVVTALALVHVLHRKSVFEDCLMSGSTVCDDPLLVNH